MDCCTDSSNAAEALGVPKACFSVWQTGKGSERCLLAAIGHVGVVDLLQHSSAQTHCW